MFIVINRDNNVLIDIGTTVSYWSNGYPVVDGMAYVPSNIFVYEVAELPSEAEVEKWCYTEADGFYPNPNYSEPSAYDLAPQDIVDAIIDEYTNELIEMGVL